MRKSMSIIWQSKDEMEELRAVLVMDNLWLVHFKKALIGSEWLWQQAGEKIIKASCLQELNLPKWDAAPSEPL